MRGHAQLLYRLQGSELRAPGFCSHHSWTPKWLSLKADLYGFLRLKGLGRTEDTRMVLLDLVVLVGVR